MATSISALGPSQPFSVALTKYERESPDPVLGVGAPPNAVVVALLSYHFKPDPVAVNGDADSPSQYVTRVVTPGADGKALITTEISSTVSQDPFTAFKE
jgi:hypothetical protein